MSDKYKVINIIFVNLVQVVENGEGHYSWLSTHAPFNCAIASPKKESKMKGLKTFIAYQLTPSVRLIFMLDN